MYGAANGPNLDKDSSQIVVCPEREASARLCVCVCLCFPCQLFCCHSNLRRERETVQSQCSGMGRMGAFGFNTPTDNCCCHVKISNSRLRRSFITLPVNQSVCEASDFVFLTVEHLIYSRWLQIHWWKVSGSGHLDECSPCSSVCKGKLRNYAHPTQDGIRFRTRSLHCSKGKGGSQHTELYGPKK